MDQDISSIDSHPEKGQDLILPAINTAMVTKYVSKARKKTVMVTFGRETSTIFDQYLIYAAWTSSKCYMKCQSGLEGYGISDIIDTSDRQFSSRLLPEDAPDTIWQVSCWTTAEAGTHEKPVYGMDDMVHYSLNMTPLMDSWFNLHDRGTEYTGAVDNPR